MHDKRTSTVVGGVLLKSVPNDSKKLKEKRMRDNKETSISIVFFLCT